MTTLHDSGRDLDAAFVRFRTTGDPEAMGRVFDGAAHELYRVALYLCHGDQERAADMVSQSFLAAIEGREGFDDSRPVLPWLLGILANRVRHVRRQERRTAELSAELQDPQPTHDPVRAAVGLEFNRALASCLDGLPEPYRGVMVLHLRHGLRSAEIAEATGRKRATVRTQMVRGLEMLRRALPVGFAASAAVSASATAALAAARQATVQAASAIGGSASWATTLPWIGALMTTKKMMTGALVFAVLAMVGMTAAGVFSTGVDDAPPVAAHGEPELAPLQPGGSSGGGEAVDEEVVAADQGEVREELGREATRLAVAVLGPGEAPVRDVGVVVVDRERREHGGRTGGDGVFAADTLAPGPVLVQLDRGPKRQVELRRGDNRVEIRLPPGIRVEGRVVTMGEEPVAGALVYAFRGELPSFGQRIATTDAAGRFVVEHVESGTLLQARATGYQPSGPRLADISGSPGTDAKVELELGAIGHRLRIEVVDLGGEPVPHARVGIAVDEDARDEPSGAAALVPKRGSERDRPLDRETFFVRAGAAGIAKVDEVPVGPTMVLARPPAADAELIGTALVTVVAGMDNRVRVRLERGAVISGRVTDEHGAPYPGLTVRSEWQGSQLLGNFEHHLGGWLGDGSSVTDAEGGYRIAGLLSGEQRLYFGGEFDPRSRRVHRTAVRHEIKVAQGAEHRHDARVRRRYDLAVRVLGPDDEPMRRWAVALEGTHGSELRRQLTGADGRFVFGSVEGGAQQLSVHAPSGMARTPVLPVPSVRFSVRLPLPDAAPELTVRLTRSQVTLGRVTGQLVDPDGREFAGSVYLMREGFAETLRAQVPRGAGGRFEFPTVPNGEFQIGITRGGPWAGEVARGEVTDGGHTEVGTIRLGEAARIVVRLVGPRPREGIRPRLALSLFRVQDGKSRPVSAHLLQRADAAWSSPPLQPGRYSVCASHQGFAPAAAQVTVRKGEASEVELRLTPGVAQTFRVQIPSDPASRALLTNQAQSRIHFVIRDAGGLVVVDGRDERPFVQLQPLIAEYTWQLSPGAYTVEAQDHSRRGSYDGRSAMVRCEVKQGGAPVQIKIR